MKKYNQIRNKKTRAAGSTDMDLPDKQRVCKWADKNNFDYATNRFLLVPKDIEKKTYALMDKVQDWWLQDWKIVARPDVCLWLRSTDELIIVEIDGAVHKKDLDMRPVYQEYGIRHIIINKEYLTKISKPWENYLDEKILNQ